MGRSKDKNNGFKEICFFVEIWCNLIKTTSREATMKKINGSAVNKR